MKRIDWGRLCLPRHAAAALLLSIGMAGCTTFSENVPGQTFDFPSLPKFFYTGSNGAQGPRADGSRDGDGNGAPIAPIIVRGNEEGGAPLKPLQAASTGEGGYVLNFENADIRDVLKAVLGDMLGVGYVVDPALQGSISLRSAKPLPRAAVLPAFEEALKLAGAALVPGASGYQVVPLSAAVQRGALGRGSNVLRAGYQVRLVPLRFIGSADVKRILEPLVAPGTIVQGNALGSMIILAGTEAEVDRAEQAIAMFDVDWLRNQSFGLFPLRYSTAADVAEDLANVIGKEGPLEGVVRIAPIAHLNSILVVSKKFSYIDQMRVWIARFDRGKDVLKPRLFVYHVQNGRAKDLAPVLLRVFGRGRAASGAGSSPFDNVAAPSARGDGISQPAQSEGVVGVRSTTTTVRTSTAFGSSPSGGLSAGDASDTVAGGQQPGDLNIQADETNNAILITTTPARYVEIEAALAQLDSSPLQVLLEASIAEVDVNDNFKYGVQASFEKGAFSVLSSAVAASAMGVSAGGLSAALLRGDIKVTLDLLSTFTKVRVISAPKLLVINNRTASLQVGDQVPIATSQAVSNITANAPTVNTIQMQDTGIILRVTPRVNRNGLVHMDIIQEVSASVPTSSSTLNSPTIQQRRVTTAVAVQDGQTIAIGGLIRDNRNRSRSGIPELKDIPGFGFLFGQSDDRVDRTELLVLITPRVIRNVLDADAATNELSDKLPLLQGMRGHAPRQGTIRRD